LRPTTRYAKSGGVYIAFQVVGDGPHDLVLVPGWISHVEYAWEEPRYRAFLERLAGFSRLILLDRRGTGLSDRVADPPTLEERMDDVRAVMDAAGTERATLLGLSEGGPMCMLFAATYPERTSSLILYGTFARALAGPDWPHGIASTDLEGVLERVAAAWGTGAVSSDHFAPSLAHDPAFRESWARFERLAVSPSGIKALLRQLYETDARHTLGVISAPSLVLHVRGDAIAPVEGARYIAEHIRGSKYVEIPGRDHFPFVGETERILDEVEEFVTGVRGAADADRVLATVMFTDIVDSTDKAASFGDRRWRDLLGQHHALVRERLARFRGREVDTAGDGFLAAFDGPARAVRCAVSIAEAVRNLGLEIRAGLHTGECETLGDKLSGIAVHTGARIASLAGAGEVLVSSTVKDLVAGSGIRFSDRGEHALKGIPGEWRIYGIESAGAGA
jgi:pimeloyl-ACP methyl ester carboxylesterase